MGTQARVVVLPKDTDELRIEDINLPDPEPYQVEVRQFATGICHSQLHQIHRPRVNNVILGHESTGVVTKVGSEVTHVEEGDTVLITWVPRNPASANSPPKGLRLPLANGDTAYTKNVFTWADITLADEQFVVKAGPNIAKDVTAIIGCAVMTGAGAVLNTAAVQAGQSVAIFGVGGVGLSTVAAARVVGANPIIAIDLDDEKLAIAREFGATETINAGNQDPVEAVHAFTIRDGEFTFLDKPVSGADFAFDCIGIPQTMKQIVASCRKGQYGARPGGVAVLVGLPEENIELNAMDMLVSEKTFKGSFCGSCTPDRDIPRFLDWHENGSLDLDKLVTRRYRLEQISEAVNALAAGEILGRAIVEFDA